ncbi:hypothetical protein [Gordonia polyisoprenivorans]|jgi:hypothetical protein|uniref:hypothetical protein n=1 Tax=Gordonia polyisoprenivorans TaxID=84595 RepID=UPI000360E1ED|nr:hypothetical protein [Gordonia polyisoprenivorans]
MIGTSVDFFPPRSAARAGPERAAFVAVRVDGATFEETAYIAQAFYALVPAVEEPDPGWPAWIELSEVSVRFRS